MSHGAAPLVAFNRVGDRTRLPETADRGDALRPALFGAYGDLHKLRSDYPLILSPAPGQEPWVLSLSDLFDRIQRSLTSPGVADEEPRRQLLALEQGIRELCAAGRSGALSSLWQEAVDALLAASGGNTRRLQATLERAGRECPLDGTLVGFDSDLSRRLVRRAWLQSEQRKGLRLYSRVQRLAQKLTDILRGDYLRSRESRQAEGLAASIGGRDRSVFDFQAMARILKTAPAAEPMPQARCARIQEAIDVLLGQAFVTEDGTPAEGGPGGRCEFDDCGEALAAFRARLPAMHALVRAIGIAELEIDNHYQESVHDPIFARVEAGRLSSDDLAMFPCLLVCVDQPGREQQAAVLELLQSGLPFKILVQLRDVIGNLDLLEGQLTLGRHGQQLARMALGLGDVYVLQAPAASLYRLGNAVLRGIEVPQGALFMAFAGRSQLESAAACDSRLFPCFVHDPSAGPRQLDRFVLVGNPQPGEDWPQFDLAFESDGHERQSVKTRFTAVDFIAADPRFAECFAAVSGAEQLDAGENAWREVADYLQLDARQRERAIPYVSVIDADLGLRRAVVDERLVDAARRCRDAWHSLQELAGIGNSHAEAQLAKARQKWQQELTDRGPAAPPKSAATVPAPATGSPPPPSPAAEPVEAETETTSDDPWIETIRCTTCNECTQINDRMFAYNADKRAFIADPDAGTYRELVQAAETCQVAIIHPGKPRNPNEPGLDDLLKRAEPFL